MLDPLGLLRAGADSYRALCRDDGELCDPVYGEPTQYGTAYHAYCRAVLWRRRPATGDREAAEAGLAAALRHVGDPTAPPAASSFARAQGTTSAGNHRDFFWPPILRTAALLGPDAATRAALAAVAVPGAFAARPPSNWAAVWLSGEWLRMRAGLSPTAPERFDQWLGEFFTGGRILLNQGLYQEPGHPNSYDLFTRLHLADILAEGYAGRWQPELERLMETGLRRSLAVQLSDGALAAAHRSSGQSWNDGAQCAYFTRAAAHFRSRSPARAAQAEAAAWRAFDSLRRWLRPAGPFSPVYNCLPPDWRVGYEPYTADAHYGSLALAFLASAIVQGLAQLPPPGPAPPATFIEDDPTWRAVVRCGPYAAQINACPAPHYDGFGLTDVTFGPGRRFHLGPSARHLEEEGWLNPGLACRRGPGRSALRICAREPWRPIGGIVAGLHPGSVALRARLPGDPSPYSLRVAARDDGLCVDEGVDDGGPVTLLLPYLRDAGTGTVTDVEIGGETVVRFRHGSEAVRLHVDGACERILHLTHGYESRRGLCGLLRLDLAQPGPVRWRLSLEA